MSPRAALESSPALSAPSSPAMAAVAVEVCPTDVTMTPVEEPVGVADEAEAPPAAAAKPRPVVSKAAIRRLAHDVGARLGRDAHLTAIVELESYVQRVLELAISAMTFSRRKSVGVSHVLFAAEANGGVPQELREATEEDLRRLQRCNPLAPAPLRKETLRHSEISEASFSKLTKSIAKRCQEKLRLTSGARHLLQLLTEFHVMRSFDRRGALVAPPDQRSATERLLMDIYACDAASASGLVVAFEGLCARMPSLLAMADVKTVDERLVRAALLPDQPWVAAWAPPTDAQPPADAAKVMGRLLRGRAADKRITNGAGSFLALAMMELQRLQAAGDHVDERSICAVAA